MKIRYNSANSSGKVCHHQGVDALRDSDLNKSEEYITDNKETERQEENLTNLVNNNSSGINYLAKYVIHFTIAERYLTFYILLRWDIL